MWSDPRLTKAHFNKYRLLLLHFKVSRGSNLFEILPELRGQQMEGLAHVVRSVYIPPDHVRPELIQDLQAMNCASNASELLSSFSQNIGERDDYDTTKSLTLPNIAVSASWAFVQSLFRKSFDSCRNFIVSSMSTAIRFLSRE